MSRITFFDLAELSIYYRKGGGQRCAHLVATFFCAYRFRCRRP